MKSDFLRLRDWSATELDAILTLTRELKNQQKRGIKHHLLAGKSLAMIFEKVLPARAYPLKPGCFNSAGMRCSSPHPTPRSDAASPLRTLRGYCHAMWMVS